VRRWEKTEDEEKQKGERPGKGERKVLRTRLRPLDYVPASLRGAGIGPLDIAVRYGLVDAGV